MCTFWPLGLPYISFLVGVSLILYYIRAIPFETIAWEVLTCICIALMEKITVGYPINDVKNHFGVFWKADVRHTPTTFSNEINSPNTKSGHGSNQILFLHFPKNHCVTFLEADEEKSKTSPEEAGDTQEQEEQPEVLAANRQYYVGGVKMQRQSVFLITMLASQNKVSCFVSFYGRISF